MASMIILDHDPNLRAVLRAALAADGHDVREATDGPSAMVMHNEQPANLILCGLLVPDHAALQDLRSWIRDLEPARRPRAAVGEP